MSLTNLYSRLKGKYRRILVTRCARHPIPIRPPHPIISFTFDDFPATAYHAGAPILEKHGFRATYYTSLGLAGKTGPVGKYFEESDLRDILSRGHELGCHTFDHRHAWETPTQVYRQAIIRNQERLNTVLPGVRFTSHSYPINYPRPRTKSVCAEYFPCSRGGWQVANTRVADANYLAAYFIEKARGDLNAIKQLIDHTKMTSSWLIFATHDLCPAPSPFGCTADFFESVVRHTAESAIPVLPVARALALMR